MAELDLQQARYEASLAERRYAACDPDNRLIAAQLEKTWETALRRVEACVARLDALTQSVNTAPPPDFAGLADDLARSEEHTSELQSLMRISYAVFCLTNKQQHLPSHGHTTNTHKH